MAERHRLESYWTKYSEPLPSDFDTLYATDTCHTCLHKHRLKRFIAGLINGLCKVTCVASIFGRLIPSVKTDWRIYF